MASSIVIYVLDETLKEKAEKLAKFMKEKCKITICNCSWKEISARQGSVMVACEHYHNCKEKNDHTKTTHTDVCVKNFDDLSDTIDKAKSGQTVPHHDVIIILGHSSVLLAQDDDLVVALRKINPTIVAFLGCCGGNSRYGPIAKMSSLLDPDDDKSTRPIIGFYQRRVYVSELEDTSLVIGLRYYMLIVDHNLQPNKGHREIGICAFGLSAYENDRKFFSFHMFLQLPHMFLQLPHMFLQLHDGLHDPTLFVNDTSEVGFVQKCCKECKLKLNDIPLTCMQFALCNPMVIDKSSSTQISISLHSVKEQIHKRQAELVKTLTAKMKGELDKKCKEKIREYQFHKLIPLIYEIDFIKLSNKTIELLKNGSWEEIDHLQFLIAVLRGHWGKNLFVIKEWATTHLMEMMGETKLQDKCSLHKYKLCCMSYVLLCDDHFVSIVKPDEQFYPFGILAWRTEKIPLQHRFEMQTLQQELLTDVHVTPVSQYSMLQLPIDHLLLSDETGKFPDDDELPWTQLYRHCNSIPDCVELYNPNHERQTWNIGNRTAHGQMRDQYDYERIDFRLAMGALSDYAKTENIQEQIQAHNQGQIIPPILCRPISYDCKDFRNVNIEEVEMEYIDENIEFPGNQDVSYIESKVIYHQNARITNNQLFTRYQLEPATNDILYNSMDTAFFKMSRNWQTVSSCRFVFAKFNNPAVDDEIQGILFYTDTHYGHNLIDFERTNMLTRPCRRQNCYRRRQEINEQLPNLPEHLRIGGMFLSAVKNLCKACKYLMQQEVINKMDAGQSGVIFPLEKIGRLTLTYNKERQLQNIALDPMIQ